MFGEMAELLTLMTAVPTDTPRLDFRLGEIKLYWFDLYGNIYFPTDFILYYDNFPNQTWHKTWAQRLYESLPKKYGEIFDAAMTATKLMEPNVNVDFISVTARFPLLKWKDSVEMAYSAQFVAERASPSHDYKFNHFSTLVLWEEMQQLGDYIRLKYTFNKIAQALRPWTRDEALKAARGLLGLTIPPTPIEFYHKRSLEKLHENFEHLTKYLLGQIKENTLNKDNFPSRYASNISYNKLPYQRFRNEAVCRIDNFYLFIDELSDYKETYTYPFQMMNTLTSNYFYRTGGMVQTIHLKASLCYLNRRSFDYFIRLGNLMRPLRFVISHDEQTRYILITSIAAEHKFQMGYTIFDNPQPAVSKFTIQAAVFGTPLPGFKAEDYGGDSTVLGVTEKKPDQKPLLDLKKLKPGA